VYVDDILGQPIVEIEKIVSFVGHTVDRPAIVENVLHFLKEFYAELGLDYGEEFSIDALAGAAVDGKLSMGDERLLSHIGSSLIVSSLNAVENEMALSGSLTAWPCKTFRDLESRSLDSSVMEKMPVQVKDVAPNCSAPHVKCTIRYDLAGG
jgi:hypothetical protein